MNKAFLPYDVFERHKRVAGFIKESDTVLDVGGELNHLSQFVSAKKIIVANLNTGDIIIKKGNLPFNKNVFDVVCSIDVLEHVPPRQRAKFVENLIQVAKKSVILSFPIGTSKHIAYEKQMISYLKKRKINVSYLQEHVKYGLPKKSEILQITRSYHINIYYSGNINLNEYLFKIFIFDPRIKIFRKIIYFSKLFLNLLSNDILYLLLSNKPYSESINRAYLIIHK